MWRRGEWLFFIRALVSDDLKSVSLGIRMNCQEFHGALQDLDDGVPCTAEMEAHRRHCVACSDLMEDFSWIQKEARAMQAETSVGMTEPPARVWASLRLQLEQEGLIREPRPVRRPVLAPAFSWFSRLSMGMAYASVFGIALGVVYLYTILYPGIQGPQLNPKLLAPPSFAVLDSLDAPPNPPFAQLIEQVPPEKREIYVSNLHDVDSSIQQLKTFLAAHPEDPFAREELFTTYQQKSRLWEDMVRWQEFPAENSIHH
jgi:hypothetical protein